MQIVTQFLSDQLLLENTVLFACLALLEVSVGQLLEELRLLEVVCLEYDWHDFRVVRLILILIVESQFKHVVWLLLSRPLHKATLSMCSFL